MLCVYWCVDSTYMVNKDEYYIYLSYSQLKRLTHEKLASIACTKIVGGKTEEVDSHDVDVSNDVSDEPETPSSSLSSPAAATAAARASASVEDSGIGCGGSAAERLLRSIHDLLESQVRRDARLRCLDDRNRQLMSDWTVAAAVIDRICFVTLAAFLVTGTVVFIVLLLTRP